jgi:drug/metabolite transporter (DMT)-like permease
MQRVNILAGQTSAALITFCILAEVGRELGFKIASDASPNNSTFVATLVSSPLLWLAVALGAANFFAWFLVLQHMSLALAYPIVSLVYVGVPLAGVLLLREKMSARQIAGAVLIAMGVACVGASGG